MTPRDDRVAVDLPQLLSELGVEFERRAGECWFRCRSGEHPDRNPSCAARDEPGAEKHGVVYCYSCKWATDVYGLVMAVKRCSFREAWNFVRRCRAQGLSDGGEDGEAYWRLLRPGRPKELEPPPGLEPVEVSSRPGSCHRYLAKRGFGWREVERFGLMDWREESRLYVPVTRHGYLISWVARTYRDGKPKVLTPQKAAGARWAMVNYDGLDRGLPEVHVTEGWASCFRVWQAGFRNAVATCGSRLKMEQVLDLAWVERFVFWQEGDHAGESFFKELLGWLGRDRLVERIRLPRGTDPADFSAREVRELYSGRAAWSGTEGSWESTSSTEGPRCSTLGCAGSS